MIVGVCITCVSVVHGLCMPRFADFGGPNV